MYLYRVIDHDRFLNGQIDNEKSENKIVSTFEYDDEEYIHFFILPEDATMYQKDVFSGKNKASFVTRWDIPYSVIKDSFGIGLYTYYSSYLDPVLEVRVKRNELKRDMLKECSKEIHEGWKNKTIHDRYLRCLGLELSRTYIENPLYLDYDGDWYEQFEVNPRLNPKFNFLNYFPVEDLKEEGLSNDYSGKEEKTSLRTKIANIFSPKR